MAVSKIILAKNKRCDKALFLFRGNGEVQYVIGTLQNCDLLKKIGDSVAAWISGSYFGVDLVSALVCLKETAEI